MGMITPPVGGLLFVTSIVAQVPLARLVRELWPFLWAQIAVLALLSLVPATVGVAAGGVRLPLSAVSLTPTLSRSRERAQSTSDAGEVGRGVQSL